MAILKNEYEISIWNEYLDSTGKKVESKGAIIGAHDMAYLGRAINPNLRREMKGTNTLTFDMVDKFFDSEKGEFVKNEFIDMLYNEQKIKLHYKNKWYEFYIKNINENKTADKLMKSFECTDSFIEELSRTGYGITFDEELNNSVNELGDFSNEILKDSVWDYRADLNSGDFTEYREERCYKIPLSQFGGSIEAYPINLQVSKDSYNKQSNMFKDMSDEEYSFTIEEDGFNELTNIYNNKSRTIELGDDISREREIFWDPYYKDNGFGLIQGQSKKFLKGDYIYVPYSYLSFIYGSIFQDSYKATEEPARYGRKGGQDLGFALQPYSKDPTDLIQFLFFENDDEILIDEEGYIANNDHHYVMTIDDWNKTLEKAFSNISYPSDDNGLIYWKAEHSDANFSTKYEVKYSSGEDYTVNVRPDTKTIDDFCWYPVYYEGYLEQIGDKDVYGARDISIADRTEYNLKADSYTTIYNNKPEEYKGMYSEKEMEKVIEDGLEPRVQSISESRIITPTLARNLIQNGEKITKTDGWEALTQNNTTEFDTGSYANLLTIAAKNTSDKDNTEDGNTDDEVINDFYLEFLSPNIMKCNDIDYEGNVSSDYALNFGLSSKEINIEKDKVYAIRICTGTWTTDNYSVYFRSNSGDKDTEEIITENEDDVNTYKTTIHKYYNFLKNYSSSLTTKNTEEEFKSELNQKILSYDKTVSNQFEKFENVYLDGDINYIIYNIFKKADEKIPDDKKDIYTELQEDTYKSWQNVSYSENRSFGKKYNVDLDKIIIGTGSIDINGNYTLSGTKENSDEDSYISFADIFEEVNDKNIDFIPYIKEAKGNIKDLTTTFHHKKVNGLWTWDEVESNVDIEDIPYLLFKAKANISTPYVGIRVESEPMTFNIESTILEQYAETNKSGVKIEVYGKDTDQNNYLVNNADIVIYQVDNNNFTDDYLKRVGWKLASSSSESSGDTGNIADSNFTFYTGKDQKAYKKKGVDISYCQADSINFEKFSGEYSDFLICKVSEGITVYDETCIEYITECTKKKIPFGTYHFAGRDNNVQDEVNRFVEHMIDAINKASKQAGADAWEYFQLPAFLDLEGGRLSNGDYTKYASDFMSLLKEKGFYPGLYASASPLGAMYKKDKNFIDNTFIWMAQYNTNNAYSYYSGHREIWQIGQANLAFNNSDEIDINYAYISPVKNLQANAKKGQALTTTTTAKSISDQTNIKVLKSSEEEDKKEETTEETKVNKINKDSLNIVSPSVKLTSDNYGDKRSTDSIKRIIIHSIGDNIEDPQAWGKIWNNSSSQVSAHYVVGKDKTVQYVDDNYIGFHATDRNSDSIGIEQSEPSVMKYVPTSDGKYNSAHYYVDKKDKDYFKNYVETVFNRTAQLTAYLCQQYNLTVDAQHIEFHNSTIDCSNLSSGAHVDPLHLWGQARINKKTYGQLGTKDDSEDLDIGLTMEGFIKKVKAYYDGTTTDNDSYDPTLDKINRENPNNDYTLRDGDLLTTAKPCWTATSFEDIASYCTNISPKTGDSCSLAYALFVNQMYYGIFWLNEINGTILDDPNITIVEPSDTIQIKTVQLIKDDNNTDGYIVDYDKYINDISFTLYSLDNIIFNDKNFEDNGELSEDKKSIIFMTRNNEPVNITNLADGKYKIEINKLDDNLEIVENNTGDFKMIDNKLACEFNIKSGYIVEPTYNENNKDLILPIFIKTETEVK